MSKFEIQENGKLVQPHYRFHTRAEAEKMLERLREFCKGKIVRGNDYSKALRELDSLKIVEVKE